MFQSLHPRIRSLLFSANLVSAMLLSACQFDPPPISSPQDNFNSKGNVSVELRIKPVVLAKSASAPRPTDSANVIVSAPDMDPKEFCFGNGTDVYALPELSAGTKRHFSIEMYRQGRLLYVGSAETTLYTDRKNSVFLHCIPQFSRVTANIHVPLDFPRKVGRTELKLWNDRDTLISTPDQPGEFLNFHLEETPGDKNYHLQFSLWDDTGALAAKSVKDTLWVPMGQTVSLNLPLVTTFSQLQMNMVVSDPQQTNVSFDFPAGKRIPTTFGEMVFSEVFCRPHQWTRAVRDNGSNCSTALPIHWMFPAARLCATEEARRRNRRYLRAEPWSLLEKDWWWVARRIPMPTFASRPSRSAQDCRTWSFPANRER